MMLDRLVAKAKAAGVHVVALGLTLDIDEPLRPLAELAKRTGGSHVRSDAIHSEREISDAVAAWGAKALAGPPAR